MKKSQLFKGMVYLLNKVANCAPRRTNLICLVIGWLVFGFGVASAEISGEVIALDGNQVEVRIGKSDKSRVAPGNKVEFKADHGGVEIGAGTGKLISHDAETIVIQVTEGIRDLG